MKKDKNTEIEDSIVETIKLIWVSEDSKKGTELEAEGHYAEIEYDDDKKETKIYLRIEKAEYPDLSHELGHFLQHRCEQVGVHFLHDEECSFAFEDLMREILRRRLYPQYREVKK